MVQKISKYLVAYKKQFIFLLLIIFQQIVKAQTPVANFTANKSAVCVTSVVTFTNASSGNITSYSWNFGSGANPSTATTAGPHNVTYSSSGTKTISLTVTGPGGSNTITKTNFVTVGFERIKIMSSNLLNYPDNTNPIADSTARHPYYRTIAAATLPDIMVVDEMNSQTGINWFLSKVLNTVSSGYAAGTFINGADTDNGIFYKTSKFSFIANKRIITDLRDINEFKLVHTLTGDTLRIYAVHLKASSGTSEEAQRALEIDSLRKVTNALLAGSNFIVCGDFNIYKSSESAYLKLLFVNPGSEGHVIDPLPLTGTWNNSSFAIYHTQSTRTRSINFGSTGGLNDRFDMMLYSKAISLSGGMSYVVNSTTPFGNDGNHYNDSINKPPNNAVTQTIADALELAADHLPVYASFDFELKNCLQPDIGVLSLTSPTSSICATTNAPLQIQIKNYGNTSVDFSSSNASVVLQATNPSSITQTFTKTISNGILSAGNTMLVNFDSTYNMNAAGTYTFNASSTLGGDGNTSNDAMAVTNITISSNTASISPAGSQLICKGDSIILTASSGTQYAWSTGATTAFISVHDTGYYSVTITGTNGCVNTSNAVHLSYKYFTVDENVFVETMGNVASNISISTHENNNGFDNDSLDMSGSAEVRNTQTSSGAYPSASGGANIFFTNTIGKNFIISGINTTGLNNITFSFGIYRNMTAATGADFLLQVSTDGINYTTVPYPALSGTSTWHYITVTGIPSAQNLRIQFKQTGNTYQYRIDDLLLSYSNNAATVTANGATTFCKGDSIILTASAASAYLWNTGANSQSISVKANGNYYVKETSANGCTSNSTIIPVTSNYCNFSISTKVLIEGFYIGNGMMNAVVDPLNHPMLCDTVEMSLSQPVPPFAILYADKKVVATNGNATFNFNTMPYYGSYYLVFRHRNSLETWSASPVMIAAPVTTFDFSTPSGNRLIKTSVFPVIIRP